MAKLRANVYSYNVKFNTVPYNTDQSGRSGKVGWICNNINIYFFFPSLGLLHTACSNVSSGAILKPLTLCKLSDLNACAVFNTTNATCQETWSGIEGGLSSFDHIGVAVLTVIQVITMEDWVFLLYKVSFFYRLMYSYCHSCFQIFYCVFSQPRSQPVLPSHRAFPKSKR